MDFLNSQHLTSQNGYAHLFLQPGEFTYSALLSDFNETTKSGVIKVSGERVPDGDGTQYDIVLSWDETGRRFVPRGSVVDLTIRPNDFVMFQFDAAFAGQPPCFILLQGKGAVEGDSRRLRSNEAFTHFFLSPGDYAYRLGSATYQISVADHRSLSKQAHQEQAQKPLLIMIEGSGVSVPHGRIVSGQSVVWAVSGAENVHIDGIRPESHGAVPGRHSTRKKV
jgi:hypothetical protein